VPAKIHFPSALLGAVAGVGLAKVATIAPALQTSQAWLFRPFWTYLIPVGLIAAFLGGALAGLLAPSRRAIRSGDLAGGTVGLFVSLTMLPERPGLLALFLLTIGYGFVGFVPGTWIGNAKAALKQEESPEP
jgi:hypothetical protein